MAGGWKTHLGCFALFGLGVYLIVVEKDVKTGVGLISMSCIGEGVAHKIEKAGL